MFKNLGFQLYTIREYIKDMDVADAVLKKIKSIGYTECHGACIENNAELGNLVVKNGISMIGTHYSWEEIKNNPEKTMDLHKRWNCKIVGVGGLGYDNIKTPDQLNSFTYDFNKTAETYAKHGFKLTYHNHAYEFMRIDGCKTIMDELFEKLDKATTSFVLDTAWVAVGGGDVRYWIEKMEGRLDILHLKDYTMKRESTWNFAPNLCEVGYGNLNWDGIMESAEKIGVKYYSVEQDTCEYDSIKSLSMSAEFLKKYMA